MFGLRLFLEGQPRCADQRYPKSPESCEGAFMFYVRLVGKKTLLRNRITGA